MFKTLLASTVLVLGSALSATAALVFTDGSGNTVNGIAQDAFSFTETATPGGGGEYTFTNNLAGSKVWGFGITNAFDSTIPFIMAPTCCRESELLNESNWGTFNIDFYNERTGQSIFGDISNVLNGDSVVHWFQDVEDGYDFGTYEGFGFVNATVSSSLLMVFQYNQQTIYAREAETVTNEVPLPAAGWMLIAALGGLAAAKRRKAA